MTQEPSHPKNQIPMPPEDFPDPTDAQLAEVTRVREFIAEAGADARTALATPTNGHRAAVARDNTDSVNSLTLLAVGGLTYGLDMLRARVDRAGAVIEHQKRSGTAPVQPAIPEDEVAKYALMGLAFRAPNVIGDGVAVVEDVLETTANVALDIASPVLNSRLFRPFRNAYDGFAERGAAWVNELAQQGRLAEDVSKDLVQDATYDVMNNVVEVVAESEEVRELVQQQTVGMLQEFLAFIQNRLRAIDLQIQRVAYKIIPGDQPDRKNETSLELPMPAPDRVLMFSYQQRRVQ